MTKKLLLVIFLLISAGISPLFSQGAIQSPLRLVDIVEHPGLADDDRYFGFGIDWDETEILATTSKSLHVYDSDTRAYKYRLGPAEPIDEGYSNHNVLVTPDHFLIRAARVNRRDKLYVYNRRTRLLERTIDPPLGSNATPKFGTAMALHGNSLYISSLHNSPGDGQPYVGAVFRYDMESWELSPLVFRSGEGEWFDGFGQEISVEGNTLLVGASRKNDFEGAAYLFKRDTGELITKLQMPVPAEDQWFGTSVLLLNGQAYVSSRSGIWQFEAATGDLVEEYFPDPLPGRYSNFGSDMEIINDELLVAWSREGIYQFDLNFKDLVRFLPNPLDTGTSSTGPGRMKSKGRDLLTRASGGTNPETKEGALLVFNVQPNQSVIEVTGGEEYEGQGNVTATISVIPPAANDILVNFETRQDSAREGIDYVGRSGTLTIPAGEPQGTIILNVLDDENSEPRERFFLDILGGSGATIAPLEIEIGILDTDDVPFFSVFRKPVPLPSFAEDELGYELAAIGNTAYVSTKDTDGTGSGQSGVRVVDLVTNELLTTLLPTGIPDGSNFGAGLAVSEHLLAVGSPISHNPPGIPGVYLYNRDDLTVRTILYPPDENQVSFGESIAIGEKFILVGLPFEDRLGYQVGDVHVYDVETSEYLYRIENPFSNISGSELGRKFGQSLTFSGNRAVIGASRRVYVFDLDEDGATLSHEVEHSTRDTSHITGDFGQEVVANEDYIVVGNPWDDSFHSNSGSVLVFDARSGDHLNTIRSRFSIANLNFGRGLSLSGNVLAVVGGQGPGVHLIEIPTGHEMVRHSANGSISYGFQQRVVLTNQHIVVGAPWGKSIKQGNLIAFRRDGRNFNIWRRGTVLGRETFNTWETTLDEGELFFRYATGWEQNDQALRMKPKLPGQALLQVSARGDLRPDARYWIQTSTTGTEWHDLMEIKVDPGPEDQPVTSHREDEMMIYTLEVPHLDGTKKSGMYRLRVMPR